MNLAPRLFCNPLVVQPLSRFCTGDTIPCLVKATILDCGNCLIPDSAIVLSGHGQADAFLKRHVNTGDTLKIFVALAPIREKIYSLIGGGPRIIRDGKVAVEHLQEGISENFARSRHPRTAAGYSKDGRRLFLITVDGRQASFSVGMSLYELAEFMLNLGVWDALNLDGGGSTTMIVNDSLVNSPSDATGDRPISNAFVVLQQSSSKNDHWLELIPPVAWVAQNSTFSFHLLSPDDAGEDNPTDVSWSCDPQIGTISKGRFFAANHNDSGYVRISWNGIKDSSRVYIKSVASIVVLPPKRMLKPGETASLRAVAFSKDNLKLSNKRFIWRVEKDIAYIERGNRIVATKDGKTTISAYLNDVWGKGYLTIKSVEHH